MHGQEAYFHAEHYLSGASRRRLEESWTGAGLEQLHARCPNLERRFAEMAFVDKVVRLPTYGMHRIHVIQV